METVRPTSVGILPAQGVRPPGVSSRPAENREQNPHRPSDGGGQKPLLLADLRECVTRQELIIHYQPLIDLASRKTTGVEALVRWRHPKQGLLPPGSFLPQAERTAVIAPLTRWVLNDALSQQQTGAARTST